MLKSNKVINTKPISSPPINPDKSMSLADKKAQQNQNKQIITCNSSSEQSEQVNSDISIGESFSEIELPSDHGSANLNDEYMDQHQAKVLKKEPLDLQISHSGSLE